MTIEGSIEVEVIARVDEGAFSRTLDAPLNRQAARAGDRFGKTFGSSVQAAVPKDLLGAATREVEAGLREIRRLQQQGRVSTDEYTAAMDRQRAAYLRLQSLQRGGAARSPAAGAVAGAAAAETASGVEAAASSAAVTAAASRSGLALGRTIGAGIGITAGIGLADLVTRTLPAAVNAADALNSSIAQSGRIFGDAAGQVQAFAADSHRNLLLSQQDALATADAFGLLLRGGGVDPAKAADLSVRLTGIAENLSALRKVPVANVLSALREGVQGNIEPLKDLGISLDAGRVKAEAYAEGLARPVRDAAAIGRAQTVVAAATANLAKVQTEHGRGTLAAAEAQDRLSKAHEALARAAAGATQPLTANQAMLARVGLTLRDTQNTTGAAASATDDYAVASQHLRAQLGTVSSQLGTKLIPYVIDGEQKFSALIDQFHAGVGAGGELRSALHGLGEVFDFLHDRTEEGVYGFAVASRGVLDVLGVLASVSDKLFHTHLHAGIDDAITKMRELQNEIERSRSGATIPITLVVTTKTANANPATHAKGFIGPTVAEGLAASGVAGPYTPQQTGATAVAKAAADARAAEKARSDAAAEKAAKAAQYQADQYAAFQERQRAAVQAAEDAARAQGEAITKGLQAQIDSMKATQSKLEDQERKILDFRASVVGEAARFTALTALSSDPSRATAAGLVGSLQSRVLAETLFQKNLTTLASRHLDKGVLAELAQAGPDQRALASALAAGTDTQIQQLNAAERASRARAASLGTLATDQQFGGGAFGKLAKQVAALEAQQRRTNALLEAEPAKIAKAVDQAGKNVKVAQKTGTRTAVAR